MNSLALFCLIVASCIINSDAICCGRGSKGFCKDCSKAGVFRRQKCCGAGSGRGSGCNIFCCNCKLCRSGNPHISFHGGWWLKKRYSCQQYRGDVENDDNDLQLTKDVFDGLDSNKDKSLSRDEFLKGLKQQLNVDFESSYSLASELLKDDNQEDVIDLLNAVQNGEKPREDQINDIIRVAEDEFRKMDSNEDGLIQAEEFDNDL